MYKCWGSSAKGAGKGERGGRRLERDRSEEVKGSAYKPIISHSLPCHQT